MGAYYFKPVKLTEKQRLFAEIYVAQAPHFNAREAAAQAGYGYTNGGKAKTNTIRDAAYGLLINPLVKEYIKSLREETAVRNRITIDDVVDHLFKVAFFDTRTLFDESGNAKDPRDLSDAAGAAIGGIRVKEVTVGSGATKIVIGNEYEYSTRDSLKAMTMLIDVLGYRQEERQRYDANGKLIESETMRGSSSVLEHKVIFEDYTTILPPEPREQLSITESTSDANTEKTGI